jgi:type IV conjugative transfer system coupling protein TraD
MKATLRNFTSGSQLLENFGLMFAAGLRLPFWITVGVFGLAIYLEMDASLSHHASYLCWLRLEALGYRWFDFSPAKAVNVEMIDGTHRLLTWGELPDYPPMSYAWADMMTAVRKGAFWASLLIIPLFIFYYWYCQRFGDRAKQRTHLRGANLATRTELLRAIEVHNAPKREADMARLLGPGSRLRAKLISAAELDAAGVYRPYVLAGIPYPWRMEQSHAMLIGTTGTGKTVELSALVAQIRERRHRAVIFDLTGAFIERFYDPDRDIILNPLDARCPQWSIFNECDSEAEFTTAWEALVPHDGGTSEPFWVQAARMLGVETCLKLKAEGRMTNDALYRELMTADLKHVHKLVERTLADPITAPEAARMAESVRAVLNTNAKPIRLLPSEGPVFSIKQWMLGEAAEGSILFLSSRYVDMSVTRTMLTTWMDTALNTLMTMPRSQDVRMWFLVDELGALHRLSALEKGLQTARNYGGAIVLGIHAFGKLKDTYGQNVAETLASLARTKLLLATDDRPTATFESDCIGHRQFREMEEGYSYGYDNVRDAVTLTSRRQLEPLVLPDDIMNMPSLTGYLRFPGGFPSAPVTLKIVNYPTNPPGFIQRPIPPTIGGQAGDADQGAGEGAPPSGDGGTGHAVDGSGAPERRVAGDAQGPISAANDVAQEDPVSLVDRFFAKSGMVAHPRVGIDLDAQGLETKNGGIRQIGQQSLRLPDMGAVGAIATAPPIVGKRRLGANGCGGRQFLEPGQPVQVAGNPGGRMVRREQSPQIWCLLAQHLDLGILQLRHKNGLETTEAFESIAGEPMVPLATEIRARRANHGEALNLACLTKQVVHGSLLFR